MSKGGFDLYFPKELEHEAIAPHRISAGKMLQVNIATKNQRISGRGKSLEKRGLETYLSNISLG